MGWLSNIFKRDSGGGNRRPPVSRSPVRSPFRRRRFEGASVDRLTADWLTTDAPSDEMIRAALPLLKRRSVWLARNNDWFRNFIRKAKTNIIGTGFRLQVQGLLPNGSPDKEGNAAVEAWFQKWCRRGSCDTSGKHTFNDLCKLAVGQVVKKGETLIRMIKEAPNADNPFGFQFQLLSADRLDLQLDRELPDGNRIRLGVELTPRGRVVAYWLRRAPIGERDRVGMNHERVPAGEILHLFYQEDDEEQHRGVPWAYSSILRLRQLGGFEEAAVVAARVGASKAGFFMRAGEEVANFADQLNEDGEEGAADDEEEFPETVEPAQFDQLPPGWGFTPYNPDYPHPIYDPFTKSHLRGVAAGLGTSYSTLTGDLSDVNFSSIRSGVLDERDHWKELQGWFAGQLLFWAYEEWFKHCALVRSIPFSPLLWNRYERHAWHGRRWAWVRPSEDMRANADAVKLRVTSRRRVATAMGEDYDEIQRELDEEESGMQGGVA